MEAKGAQMGGGGSLVNKLVQAGLCFTKVNHEILAEAGQKCYCELPKFWKWGCLELSVFPKQVDFLAFSHGALFSSHSQVCVCLFGKTRQDSVWQSKTMSWCFPVGPTIHRWCMSRADLGPYNVTGVRPLDTHQCVPCGSQWWGPVHMSGVLVSSC